MESVQEMLEAMSKNFEIVQADAAKGMEGNKQAARRARKALNEIKKACPPLRQIIQSAVKKED